MARLVACMDVRRTSGQPIGDGFGNLLGMRAPGDSERRRLPPDVPDILSHHLKAAMHCRIGLLCVFSDEQSFQVSLSLSLYIYIYMVTPPYQGLPFPGYI